MIYTSLPHDAMHSSSIIVIDDNTSEFSIREYLFNLLAITLYNAGTIWYRYNNYVHIVSFYIVAALYSYLLKYVYIIHFGNNKEIYNIY